MSWNDQTDDLIRKRVDMCGIYSTEGAAWAQSPKFQCKPEEIIKLRRAIAGEDIEIQQRGIQINEKMWTFIKLDEEEGILILKGKEPDNKQQNIVVGRCEKTLVLGGNSADDMKSEQVVSAVTTTQKHLKYNGF